MKKKKFHAWYIIAPLYLLLIIYFALLIRNGNLQLLHPQGTIAQAQSQLLWEALLLACCIGIPLVGITFFVAFRYRSGNKKRKYTPNATASHHFTVFWWIISLIFVLCLSSVIWITAHEIDPYKPLASRNKPITVNVVALQWKWLFIYPDEGIATVNYLEIPVHTPISFHLTADAPMNSFWIPSLGGQIYAMAGMVTQLHLQANSPGVFPGGGAEMSGPGFSGMTFSVHAVPQNIYNEWVTTTHSSQQVLDLDSYTMLAKPSSNNPPTFYMYGDKNLYNEIIMKYMAPSPTETMTMPGM